MSDAVAPFETALFPLRAVLFPGGVLPLKVFEVRYLDLVSRCLRDGSGFGVVCLRAGSEVRDGHDERLRFENVGVMAQLDEVDAERAGLLQVRCRGTRRFALEQPTQQADGLWRARAHWLPDDEPQPPPAALQPTVRALASAIEALARQDAVPFDAPYRLDDAGWVANRWCELLPIPLPIKQKLMALDAPVARLQLVDEFLRRRGVLRD